MEEKLIQSKEKRAEGVFKLNGISSDVKFK